MSIPALEKSTGYEWDRKVRRGRGLAGAGRRQAAGWTGSVVAAPATALPLQLLRRAAAPAPPALPLTACPCPPRPLPQDIGWMWTSCGDDRRRAGRRMSEHEAEESGELFHTEILIRPARTQ